MVRREGGESQDVGGRRESGCGREERVRMWKGGREGARTAS
jgi:hypothetical protein